MASGAGAGKRKHPFKSKLSGLFGSHVSRLIEADRAKQRSHLNVQTFANVAANWSFRWQESEPGGSPLTSESNRADVTNGAALTRPA